MLLKTVQSAKPDPKRLITHRSKLTRISETYDTFGKAATSKALRVILETRSALRRRRSAWVDSEPPAMSSRRLRSESFERHDRWRLERAYSTSRVTNRSLRDATTGTQNARIS
jgi:hypothetical protein